MGEEPKPGWRTSELYVVAATAVIGLLKTDGLTGWQRVALVLGLTALAAVYVLGRARVKGGSGSGGPSAAALLLIVAGASGCALFASPPAYDPNTVANVDATIAYEAEDHELTRASLERVRLLAPPLLAAEVTRAMAALEVRHDSEMARLRTWRRAEEAKQGGDEGRGDR